MEWVPFTSPESETYPVMEYAKLYDTVLYDCLVKFEEEMKAPNDEITLKDGK